jgi:hypothetical protein
MKKPTLETIMARKPAAVPAPESPPPAARKADDGKVTTSMRIDADKMEALKVIAVRERVRVNDLVVEGINHVIAQRRGRAA